MRGHGVKDLRTGRPGDQYIHLDIKLPNNLNKQQKELLTKYRDSVKMSDTFIATINAFKK